MATQTKAREKRQLLQHDGFLGRLEEIKDHYRLKSGDLPDSFDVARFTTDMKEINRGVVPCWELKKCERWFGGKKEQELGMCLVYPWGGWQCWAIAGTLCGGVVQGSAAQKEGNCQMCPHYLALMEDDPAKLKSDSLYFSTVMQHMLIGIGTINPKGVIDFQSSRKFQEFLGKDVAGKNLATPLALSPEDDAKLNEWIKDVFELYGTLSWDMLWDMFPLKDKEIPVNGRHYRLTMAPYLRRDAGSGQEKLFRVLVQVSDVSAEVRAKELAYQERVVTDTIMARVKNLGSFKDFINQSHQMLPRAEVLVKRFMEGDRSPALLEEAYRIMHTLKGTSGNFAMDSFVKTAHDSERFFGILMKISERDKAGDEVKQAIGEFKNVFNNFQSLQNEIKEAVQFMADHAGIEIEVEQEGGLAVNVNTKLLNEAMKLMNAGKTFEAMKLLQRAKEVPIKPLFQEMAAQVERIAADRGKEAVFSFKGDDITIDKDLQVDLSAVLVHMVRNAIDHGIEKPEDRIAAGKEPAGYIELGAVKEGEALTVTLKDDGKGIDLAKIREKAGLPEGTPMEQIVAQIYKSGFSTLENATTTSGRGVGMDVVKTTLEEKLKGKVHLKTEQGRGTEISLLIPLKNIGKF